MVSCMYVLVDLCSANNTGAEKCVQDLQRKEKSEVDTNYTYVCSHAFQRTCDNER